MVIRVFWKREGVEPQSVNRRLGKCGKVRTICSNMRQVMPDDVVSEAVTSFGQACFELIKSLSKTPCSCQNWLALIVPNSSEREHLSRVWIDLQVN